MFSTFVLKVPPITTVVSFFTDPPDIAVDSQNRTVTEGNNVSLFCNVSGNPEPSILWTKDGFLVNATMNSWISFSADKKQLTITNAKRTDNGNYRCVANNSLGIATSDAATVDVRCKYNTLVNSLCMTQLSVFSSGRLISFSFKSCHVRF